MCGKHNPNNTNYPFAKVFCGLTQRKLFAMGFPLQNLFFKNQNLSKHIGEWVEPCCLALGQPTRKLNHNNIELSVANCCVQHLMCGLHTIFTKIYTKAACLPAPPPPRTHQIYRTHAAHMRNVIPSENAEQHSYDTSMKHSRTHTKWYGTIFTKSPTVRLQRVLHNSLTRQIWYTKCVK